MHYVYHVFMEVIICIIGSQRKLQYDRILVLKEKDKEAPARDSAAAIVLYLSTAMLQDQRDKQAAETLLADKCCFLYPLKPYFTSLLFFPTSLSFCFHLFYCFVSFLGSLIFPSHSFVSYELFRLFFLVLLSHSL